MVGTIKNIVKIAGLLVIVVALGYIAVYGYLITYAAFTWQCNIYVGPQTAEAREVCDNFNSGGFIKVLTN